MPSETDVAPKAISGRDWTGWKSLDRAVLRAPLVLIIQTPGLQIRKWDWGQTTPSPPFPATIWPHPPQGALWSAQTVWLGLTHKVTEMKRFLKFYFAAQIFWDQVMKCLTINYKTTVGSCSITCLCRACLAFSEKPISPTLLQNNVWSSLLWKANLYVFMRQPFSSV